MAGRTVRTEAEKRLSELLSWLSEKLDEGRQGAITELHRRALSWEPVDRLPLVLSYPLPPEARFQPWPHHEIFDDPAKMLFTELVHAFECSVASRPDVGDDLPCTIRANFGTVIIASLFGAQIEQVDDNPPWVRSDPTKSRPPKSLLDRDPGDFSQGWCPKVIERYRFYNETLREYPRLQPLVRVVLPDLQGPFDTLELLCGSALFTELYDHSDDVAAALRALAAAQIGFASRLAPLLSDGPAGFTHQHATMIRGRILIRDDTAILASPGVYREVIAAHDEQVLRSLGGGGIHCCGRVDRHVAAFLSVPGVECFDFGQAELNDLDAIYHLARTRKRALIRVWASEAELLSGQVLDRFPTGVSLRHQAPSLADARRIMAGYLQACAARAGAGHRGLDG